MSIIIANTPKTIFCLHNGQAVAHVDKADIENVTSYEGATQGYIEFELTSSGIVRFAFLIGKQFDTALAKVIEITNEMEL